MVTGGEISWASWGAIRARAAPAASCWGYFWRGLPPQSRPGPRPSRGTRRRAAVAGPASIHRRRHPRVSLSVRPLTDSEPQPHDLHSPLHRADNRFHIGRWLGRHARAQWGRRARLAPMVVDVEMNLQTQGIGPPNTYHYLGGSMTLMADPGNNNGALSSTLAGLSFAKHRSHRHRGRYHACHRLAGFRPLLDQPGTGHPQYRPIRGNAPASGGRGRVLHYSPRSDPRRP